MSEFIVAAVDLDGRWVSDKKIIEPMWHIISTENYDLREVSYGQVPSGWREVQASIPLKMRVWYTIGAHYFKIYDDGATIRSDVLSHTEFWKQLNSKN